MMLKCFAACLAASMIMVSTAYAEEPDWTASSGFDRVKEPSGLTAGRDRIYVVGDEGHAGILDASTGKRLFKRRLTGENGDIDLEGITISADGSVLFFGLELPPRIVAVPLDTFTSTEKKLVISGDLMQWALPGLKCDEPNRDCMEALVLLPPGHHPYEDVAQAQERSVFLAASTVDGRIHAFAVDISVSGAAVRLTDNPAVLDATGKQLESWMPSTQTNLSDMFYSPANRSLYVLYDSGRKRERAEIVIQTYPASGRAFETVATYATQCRGSEGIAVILKPKTFRCDSSPQPSRFTVVIAYDPSTGQHACKGLKNSENKLRNKGQVISYNTPFPACH